MIKVLYGSFRFEKKIDIIMAPFKLMYIIFTLPFLALVLLFFLRSLGAFGNPMNERFTPVKKVLLHFAAVVWSVFLWAFISMTIESAIYK